MSENENENATTPETDDQMSAFENRHYHLILETTKEVNEALLELNDAKAIASDAKKHFDKINESLLFLISKGPNPQQKFDFSDGELLSSPLSAIGISPKLVETLEEEGGFANLGELRDYWLAGNDLTNFSGIGAEKSAEIADAYAAFMEKHEADEEGGSEGEPEEEETPQPVEEVEPATA